MDQKKPNKISDIVRLQQILKKWKKLANAPKPTTTSSSKSMKFLKRTLSFSDSSVSSLSSSTGDGAVPKGFLAVSVGEEMKRFVIPTEYLTHRAFGILLREAEEEFGFQQEGVLRIPCEVPVFERILKVVEEKREVFFMQEIGFNGEKEMVGCCSSRAEISTSHHPPKPMCR
ncbi:protein SMALL AUXIN UP-REGULATED RNA 51-like [Magnolia sinica]|uniref:protein SMALL AUXIN UP-REGULATED RNA 51-like n=1 Tax=Magnolia sinica TaxID=86752 RepID=UPI00265A057F|nr:protein SMALL AUXIN UP-REGULATED RNA 51-like [Magnolia sinica]